MIRLVGLILLLLNVTFIYTDNGDSADESNSDSLHAEEENDVLVLTTANFDAVVNSHDTILVEFYAPWCGHCKTLAPEYEAAAVSLKQNTPPVALAKVDATVEEALATRYGVSGYPTLKFFKDGQVHDYDGPRQEIGIVEYMKVRADPEWKPPPSSVIVLTNSNFTEFLEDTELALVQFYAPWCGHCKKLAPEFEKGAQHFKDNIPFAKVDATVDSDLAKTYEVTGYPTLKVFRHGKDYEYKGNRNSANDFIAYMGKQQGPASKEQKSLKDISKLMGKEDVTIVGFFSQPDEAEYKIYEYFSNNVRDDYLLMHTFDEAARKHYNVDSGTMVIFTPERFQSQFEEKFHVFDIEKTTIEEELIDFVKTHEVPLVGQLTQSNKDKRYLTEGRKPLVIFFYDVDWSFDYRVATEQNRQKVLKIAKNYVDDFTFVIADEKQLSEYFKGFGFDDSSEDLNVGILSPGNGKYPMEPMEDGFEEELVHQFLKNYQNGKLKAKLKSQRPPKKQGPVTVVVGDTFEKIVMDKKKDVLIEFYAPWCGHCKKLEPKFKELAKKHKKESNLIVAKLDATSNEAPEQFEVQGYPTIYLAPANNKMDPIKYEGPNEIEDLTKFIKEHSAASFRTLNKEEL